MRKSITIFFLFYTAIGFIASLIIHFLLFFGFSLYKESPSLWLIMHLSIFVGYIGLYLLRKPGRELKAEDYTKDLGRLMLVITILFVLLVPYTIINFFYYQSVLKHGYPDRVNGQYLLVLEHGQKPKVLTEEEFARAETYQARKTSGHWMLAHLFPLMLLYMNYKLEGDE
ncbi:MAG TPA: hypothetical protein VJS44_08825 [Pyrinomonadaceae bacterium]|nr:hypothetical protein [Pyrinomonadaceae bacterium]